ncbi:MAG: WYL domain-containing protein [Rhodoferax sp.]|uniref:helix-turn-helix transcriptional regulator n=1 Tax=Rhodoferax sp. TaxID=50421 RepID=UPI00261A7D7F|nr:WYL domain-containing protein [Rhodoferax sp.]MDD2882845.1 WYL domain-containing protein [Rhodoferax sp.]
MPIKKTSDHDTLVYRLCNILGKLNQGEKLDPHQLALEFNVNPRTIQRDLNERFNYLPLVKTEGLYHLDTAFLGKLSLRDIEHFASLAGVRGLFPSLSDDFLRDVFDARIQSTLLVKGHEYENLGGKTLDFTQLQQAIVARHMVSFSYQKPQEQKSYANVQPYKLVNKDGIWYLAGKDGDKLKAFAFTKIDRLVTTDGTFSVDPAVEQTLATEDDIWLNDKKIEVVLKIASPVASYFKRRKLVANQVIEKVLEDNGLIVSSKVAHINQILPTVRYWLPHIRIISPEGMQSEMEREMRTYLAGD